MSEPAFTLSEQHSKVWQTLKEEVHQQLLDEPLLGGFLQSLVLDHDDLKDGLCTMLAHQLQCRVLTFQTLHQIVELALGRDPSIVEAAEADLLAFRQRDPACDRFSLPFLYYKGYQGLQMYRVTNCLWNHNKRELALYLQSRISLTMGIDIHPAAKIGKGILIDHANSLVIGETAIVGDNVSMLHEVTLGGTGKETGNRHPKVKSGVLIGAGAKILGNVVIGEGVKIGAGSVVLDDVADHCTVAGVPAKMVGDCGSDHPALEMDHSLDS